MVAGAADQPGARDQLAAADRGGRRLLARHLRLAVALDVRFVAGRAARAGLGLVRADDRVRRVDAARGDVRPVRGLAAQGGQSAADHPGLPGNLDHRIPVAAAHRVVAVVPAPVRGDQDRAVGDRSALAAGQASHGVPAADRLPGQLPAQPRRPAEYEDLHGLKLARPGPPSPNGRESEPGDEPGIAEHHDAGDAGPGHGKHGQAERVVHAVSPPQVRRRGGLPVGGRGRPSASRPGRRRTA